MDDAKRELVQAWLRRAREDLLSALKLSEEPDPLFATALYHCQQSAEKALKGFLTFHDQPFEKTHDIAVLLKLSIPFDSNLSVFVGAANQLSRYAVIYRYPSEEPEPDRTQFEPVLHQIEMLEHLVLQGLPASCHP